VADDRDRVERDPEYDHDRLHDDVLRRAEEACRLLRDAAERVFAECADVCARRHALSFSRLTYHVSTMRNAARSSPIPKTKKTQPGAMLRTNQPKFWP